MLNYRFSSFRSLLVLCLSACISSNTLANPVIPIPTQPQQPTYTPTAPNLQAKGYILIDATSGKVIAEHNSRERMPPASLTKLMSMYIISSAIKGGQIKLEDKVLISKKAWQMEGSRMFVKVGDEVPVNDLLQGIIVVSGNDATVAMAEHVAGTEEAFTEMMNQQAKRLGMNDSHFTDSTGLPDPDHYTTAYDLALLSKNYIKNFPEEYVINSEKWFTYNNIKQPNRNRLLWRYQNADGLKTGHTNDAGYCLVASAKKDGMRLISVVLGAPNDNARTEDSIRLLNYGFRFYETRKIYSANATVVQARVWKGEKTQVALGVQDDMFATLPTGQYKKLKATLTIKNPLQAPLKKGETYGTLKIILNNQVLATKPLVALEDNPTGGLWRRASDTIRFKMNKYLSNPDDKVNTG
jgi:D-alanyl-D-alanine carboxypeptidase (penicillin-binding protein 5/6)